MTKKMEVGQASHRRPGIVRPAQAPECEEWKSEPWRVEGGGWSGGV